ncbi:unnamed protein product [Microthlaspi erraticum]|uniref:Uncharacterized protein n=1 Tax=Microthlaspi erraticum TaxID=1685480 RepID=A0A6D2HZC6_9BRAS|nr:unnamed protein product [Microthlaspi erraticum]
MMSSAGVNIVPVFHRNSDAIDIGDGKFRNIFKGCLRALNHQAMYFEGLNLVYGYAEYEKGVEILDSISSTYPLATIASAIFHVCLGECEKASTAFQVFNRVTGLGLTDARAQTFGGQFKSDLWWFAPDGYNDIPEYFQFPNDDFVQFPYCIFDNLYYHKCNNCYMFHLAKRVYEIVWFKEKQT